MKRLFVILSLHFICCFCYPLYTKGQDRATKIFSKYISKEFNLRIGDSLHYYALIPKFGCRGCFKQSLIDLNKIIKDENKKYFTIITSNPKVLTEEIKSRIQIYIDTLGKLDVLNLEIANLMIVETQNKKVNFIRSVNTIAGDTLSNIIKIQ